MRATKLRQRGATSRELLLTVYAVNLTFDTKRTDLCIQGNNREVQNNTTSLVGVVAAFEKATA